MPEGNHSQDTPEREVWRVQGPDRRLLALEFERGRCYSTVRTANCSLNVDKRDVQYGWSERCCLLCRGKESLLSSVRGMGSPWLRRIRRHYEGSRKGNETTSERDPGQASNKSSWLATAGKGCWTASSRHSQNAVQRCVRCVWTAPPVQGLGEEKADLVRLRACVPPTARHTAAGPDGCPRSAPKRGYRPCWPPPYAGSADHRNVRSTSFLLSLAPAATTSGSAGL
jgi:hypothetical protein